MALVDKEKPDEIIQDAKMYALTNTDIQRLLPVDTNIFTYEQLDKTAHIDNLFDGYGRAIMLFLTDSAMSGHWIALIRRGNVIEAYDPYGFSPSEWKRKLQPNMEIVKTHNQDKPLLEQKVRGAGYKLVWNKKQQQPKSPNVNTCGRWSVMRLLFADFTLDEFNKMIDSIYKETGISGDTLATALTMESLGK